MNRDFNFALSKFVKLLGSIMLSLFFTVKGFEQEKFFTMAVIAN